MLSAVDAFWKEALWGQFGAAIESLERAIGACPEDRWYLVYHTLFWLDLYLNDAREIFAPPAPYNLDELDPAGLMPDRVYSRAEMLRYLEHGYAKCRARIAALTPEQAREMRPRVSGEPMSEAEMLLYNLRHVQHHTAQLNLMLRHAIDSAPRWVGRARVPLGPP
jgi:DinB superfamily